MRIKKQLMIRVNTFYMFKNTEFVFLFKFFRKEIQAQNESENLLEKYYGMIRFMGTTIRSTSIADVYYSLIYQLIYLFGPIIGTNWPKHNLNKTELRDFLKKLFDRKVF